MRRRGFPHPRHPTVCREAGAEHDTAFDWLVDVDLDGDLVMEEHIEWELTRAAELLHLANDPRGAALRDR